MNGWMDTRWLDGWINGQWMDGRIGGWVDGWMGGSTCRIRFLEAMLTCSTGLIFYIIKEGTSIKKGKKSCACLRTLIGVISLEVILERWISVSQ